MKLLVSLNNPFFNPSAKQEICNAEVLLFTTVAYLDLVNFFKLFSSNSISGP